MTCSQCGLHHHFSDTCNHKKRGKNEHAREKSPSIEIPVDTFLLVSQFLSGRELINLSIAHKELSQAFSSLEFKQFWKEKCSKDFDLLIDERSDTFNAKQLYWQYDAFDQIRRRVVIFSSRALMLSLSGQKVTQFGKDFFDRKQSYYPTELRNPFLPLVKQLAALGDTICLFLSHTGKVYRENKNGQIVPVQKFWPEEDQIIQIAAGTEHELYLTSRGKVYGQGSNRHYALGEGGDVREYSLPYQGLVQGSWCCRKIVEVAAGDSYSLFLTEDGNVYGTGWHISWGNDMQQWGEERHSPTLIEMPDLKENERVNKIVGGKQHTLCLTNAGRIYGFGAIHALGGHSALGLSVAHPSVYIQTPQLIVGPWEETGEWIVGMAAGDLHSLFLTSTGLVYYTQGRAGIQLMEGEWMNRCEWIVGIAAGHLKRSILLTNQGHVYFCNPFYKRQHASLVQIPQSKLKRSSKAKEYADPSGAPFLVRPEPSRYNPHRQWASDDSAKNCHLCGVVFSLFKRRHHCRSCGEVVCDNCSNLRALLDKPLSFPTGKSSDKQHQPLRICKHCAEAIRTPLPLKNW